MKYAFLVLAISLFASISTAQDIPEIEWKIEIDEFTGDSVITSGWVSLYLDITMESPSIDVFFARVDSTSVLQVQYTHRNPFFIFKENPLYLKTESGTVIKLESMIDVYPERSSVLYIGTSFYQIRRDELEVLKKEGLSKIRAVLHDEQFDCTVNEPIKPRINSFVSEALQYCPNTN